MQELERIRDKLTHEEDSFLCHLIQRDPLHNIYVKSLLLYMGIATLFLLWPFDFIFVNQANHLHWIPRAGGIDFQQPGQALSKGPTEALCGRLVAGHGLTLEVWCSAGETTQDGPARIVS